MTSTAGIVLAGGRSRRMGTAKAGLEWHGSTLLRRITGLIARSVTTRVVVVRAAGQPLPTLPAGVEVVDDDREDRGPLQGIAAGFAALAGEVDVAYVSSTDVPLLHPAFVACVLRAVDPGTDVAVPIVGGHRHPLAAAYRTSLLPVVNDVLDADQLRPAFLFDRVRTRFLAEADLLANAALAAADPALDSVRNVNEPADYEAVRALAAPAITTERFGVLRPNGSGGEVALRAATLARAAAGVGLTLDRHMVAAINGDTVTRDPELPLVAGDHVGFLVADAGG